MTTAMETRRSLSRLGQDVLLALYQHRLVSTGQLRELFTPHSDRPVYLLRELGRMRRLGLVDATDRRRDRTRRRGRCELLWFVTPEGAELAEYGREVMPRAYRISAQAAASQIQEHTLAVVESGLAFVSWARRLGDDCGPWDWDPEIAHRIRDGDRAGQEPVLLPDAVLRYTHSTEEGRRLLTFFLEIDRATMHVSRLSAKLAAYARYASYVPQPVGRGRAAGREAWRERYPALPRLLFVFDAAPDLVLTRRGEDLRALAASMPAVRRSPVVAGMTTLERLRNEGPFAPIVMPILGEPVLTSVDMPGFGLSGAS
ncbi:replication-relaxation family protein [Streptomyces sp. NPDC001054]